MSMYGEAIRSRLPQPSILHDNEHPMSKIIDNTFGELFDKYDVQEWFNQFFLTDATGDYLDIHGKQYGVMRRIDETDESYRERIIYTMMGHLTVNYLKDIYGLELYPQISTTYTNNTLLSDNEYLQGEGDTGYYAKTDDSTKNILNKKFILEEDQIVWL